MSKTSRSPSPPPCDHSFGISSSARRIRFESHSSIGLIGAVEEHAAVTILWSSDTVLRAAAADLLLSRIARSSSLRASGLESRPVLGRVSGSFHPASTRSHTSPARGSCLPRDLTEPSDLVGKLRGIYHEKLSIASNRFAVMASVSVSARALPPRSSAN